MTTFEVASQVRPVPVHRPDPEKPVKEIVFPVNAEYLRRKAPPAGAAASVNPEFTIVELRAKFETATVPVLV